MTRLLGISEWIDESVPNGNSIKRYSLDANLYNLDTGMGVDRNGFLSSPQRRSESTATMTTNLSSSSYRMSENMLIRKRRKRPQERHAAIQECPNCIASDRSNDSNANDESNVRDVGACTKDLNGGVVIYSTDTVIMSR